MHFSRSEESEPGRRVPTCPEPIPSSLSSLTQVSANAPQIKIFGICVPNTAPHVRRSMSIWPGRRPRRAQAPTLLGRPRPVIPWAPTGATTARFGHVKLVCGHSPPDPADQPVPGTCVTVLVITAMVGPPTVTSPCAPPSARLANAGKPHGYPRKRQANGRRPQGGSGTCCKSWWGKSPWAPPRWSYGGVRPLKRVYGAASRRHRYG